MLSPSGRSRWSLKTPAPHGASLAAHPRRQGFAPPRKNRAPLTAPGGAGEEDATGNLNILVRWEF